MEAPHILALQFTLSFVAYAALSFWYVWPWLRTKPQATALAILVFPQTFRFIGFTLLVPGVVAPGLPDEFARSTAIGDGVTTLLAWLSLIALRAGWRLAVPLVWLFNLVGLGDLLLNLSRGLRLQVASQLGAAWFGPAFIVPGMLVIHVLIFVSLRRGGPHVAEHIISLERSALDRWIRADPDGYLSLYARDATYFDPFREKRVDGLDELNARMAAMRGVTLPFTEPRYDMISPVVQVDGNIAVLTFNLVNFGKPAGSAEETVLARWNATEVYREVNGAWRIIHTHWSFTQPQIAAPPAI